jgi:hypothetical protein
MVAHSTQITSSPVVIGNEIPIGDVDGLNKIFSLYNTPVADSVIVRLSGVVQVPGLSKDYTISGSVITFIKAPKIGQEVVINYLK